MTSIIHVAPLHKPAEGAARRIVRRLPEIFGVPAEFFTPEIDLKKAFNIARRQYHTGTILAALLEQTPSSEGKVLGVTEVDLYIPVLTFVFGEAQLDGRAAVASMHRLRNSFYGLPRTRISLRTVRKIIPELGHTFNLNTRQLLVVMHSSTMSRTSISRTPRFAASGQLRSDCMQSPSVADTHPHSSCGSLEGPRKLFGEGAYADLVYVLAAANLGGKGAAARFEKVVTEAMSRRDHRVRGRKPIWRGARSLLLDYQLSSFKSLKRSTQARVVGVVLFVLDLRRRSVGSLSKLALRSNIRSSKVTPSSPRATGRPTPSSGQARPRHSGKRGSRRLRGDPPRGRSCAASSAGVIADTAHSLPKKQSPATSAGLYGHPTNQHFPSQQSRASGARWCYAALGGLGEPVLHGSSFSTSSRMTSDLHPWIVRASLTAREVSRAE
jgi:archaemetzincin